MKVKDNLKALRQLNALRFQSAAQEAKERELSKLAANRLLRGLEDAQRDSGSDKKPNSGD